MIGTRETGNYERTIRFGPAIFGAEMRLNIGVALAAAEDPRFASVAKVNDEAIRAVES